MLKLALVFALLVCALSARAQTSSNTNPAVGTPYIGCVEGRALRIVNGVPSCSSTVPPTLTACGAGVIDTGATDFIGQVTLPAGLTSCTVVMTKLYSTTFICIIQAQGGGTLSLGSSTIGNNGTKSTLLIPFGLSLTNAKFGYVCGPG